MEKKEKLKNQISALSDLYENAKALILRLEYPLPNTATHQDAYKLMEAVREMRDMAAVYIKATYFPGEDVENA